MLERNKNFRRFWVGWGIYGVLFYALFGCWALTQAQGWKVLLLAAAAALFARYVVCEFVHLLYKKPHPYQRLGLNTPSSWLFSLKDRRNDAFPSEHATTAAAISLVIFLFAPLWGELAFAVTAFIGLARTVIGFHELTDVVWGYLFGLISGYFIYLLLWPRLFT